MEKSGRSLKEDNSTKWVSEWGDQNRMIIWIDILMWRNFIVIFVTLTNLYLLENRHVQWVH